MTDTSGTAGQALDSLIADVRQAVQELQTELQPKLAELGGTVNEKIDALQTKVDNLQAAAQAQ